MKQLVRLVFVLAVLGGGIVGRPADAPRFNHAAFYVRDLKASADFYREVVGLPVIPEPFNDGKHAWFALGPGMALHLISGAQSVLPKEKRTHLCLSVTSMDAFVARLNQARVPYEDLAGRKSAITRRPDGVNQIYFQDPDGNWIEINNARIQPARKFPAHLRSPERLDDCDIDEAVQPRLVTFASPGRAAPSFLPDPPRPPTAAA